MKSLAIRAAVLSGFGTLMFVGNGRDTPCEAQLKPKNAKKKG